MKEEAAGGEKLDHQKGKNQEKIKENKKMATRFCYDFGKEIVIFKRKMREKAAGGEKIKRTTKNYKNIKKWKNMVTKNPRVLVRKL